MLFEQTEITGIFGFENRKSIFENVDSRFKFVVLTFEKGGQTQSFPSAFMRQDVTELERFPKHGALNTSVELIHKLSPDSLSIMEFKDEVDVTIAQKMLKFPLLGEKLEGTWNISLSREFDMTNDSKLFKTEPAPDRLPLYQGKMIHQFTNTLAKPQYWINEKEGRTAILGRRNDTGQKLDYQCYRLGYRAIGRTTDQRALIATVLPHNAFVGNSLIISRRFQQDTGDEFLDDGQVLFTTAMMDSFIADYFIGQKISANLNMFYIYQLPIPRLTKGNVVFDMIAERAARLVCTTPEFQALWESVMPNSTWSPDVAASEQMERRKLRAELDGIIAHLYELTREEFSHILSTFPLVEQGIKNAALDAYDLFTLESEDLALMQIIEKGETDTTEFKVAACWNARTGKKDDSMRNNIIEEVAAFLNSYTGGTVLIGVDDAGNVVGLEDDYRTANAQKNSRDGYALFLRDALKDSLIGIWTQFYTISFGVVLGKEVCRIDIQPSNEAVFTKNNEFHIRDGNRKRRITGYEARMYQKNRWG